MPKQQTRWDLQTKLLVALAVIVLAGLVLFRGLGLVRLFSVPTEAMQPAISAGDHFLMERFTYLSRQPHRPDIVVFKTDGLGTLKPGEIQIKRIVGEPGDSLNFSDGKLFINNRPVVLSNKFGKIHYVSLPFGKYLASPTDVVKVPADSFFVLGDNSTNSSDSRFWAFLPTTNILGKASFCYWPPRRVGGIR
jgi:signal peptidase I